MASLTTTPSRVLRSPTALYPFFAPAVAGSARSCSIVCARARSRRAWPSRDGFLATPIESWKRRLKSSSVNSRTRCRISSSDRSRHLAAFIARSSRAPPSQRSHARDELRRDPHLLSGGPECLARGILGDALHLIEDATR